MEDSSPLQSLTLNPSQTGCAFPTHRRRPLRSRTYDSLVRILSHCRPQLQMQGLVSDEDGSITCSQILTTHVKVSPNSKVSEDNVVGETSDGETKEKTSFQDSDSKQATPTKFHLPELVRDIELELIPSNQISIEDCLVVEEQVNPGAVQSTEELENVFCVQIDDFDSLKDVRTDKDPHFLQSNEILNGSDMVVEPSEAAQLTQEEDTVLAENIPKDVEHELQTKVMELEKLLYNSGTTEVSFCQNSGEIEEGEISGDDGVADESFDALTEGASLGEETAENLHCSKGYFDRNSLLFEDKDRGRQQHGMSDLSLMNTVNIESSSKKEKSRTLIEQLPGYYSQDITPQTVMETPKSNDIHNCLDNLTLPERNHLENADGNQISMSTEKDEDAGKNKRKRGMTKERRAKKKKKERLKRAEKNRELGVKRLKLPTVLMPKKIVYCRHYLQGRCHEGEKCKFSHDTVPLTKSKPCGHFARHACMKGDHCPYDHQLSKYPCNNYSLNGFCNRGSECMFSHEMAAKSSSATPSLPKHDLIPPHQTVPEKQGSHPISKIYKSELKSPSPLNNSNCGRPMDSCGRSHQKDNSRLCSVANSPAQREELALKPLPRTGGQAPRGVNFLLSGAAPLGDSNKDKQDESHAKRTDSAGAVCNETVNAPGGINMLNGAYEVVAPRKPDGINFLSFSQPPSDDSSNKILSNFLSGYNNRMGKSAVDGMGGKLTSNANTQLIGSAINLVSDVTEKANGTPLTVPQNVKVLPFNRSHLDATTLKENANLDSPKGDPALSFSKERQNATELQDTIVTPSPSSGVPSHQSSSFNTSLRSNTSGLVRKAVQSTLAFATQLESDI